MSKWWTWAKLHYIQTPVLPHPLAEASTVSSALYGFPEPDYKVRSTSDRAGMVPLRWPQTTPNLASRLQSEQSAVPCALYPRTVDQLLHRVTRTGSRGVRETRRLHHVTHLRGSRPPKPPFFFIGQRRLAGLFFFSLLLLHLNNNPRPPKLFTYCQLGLFLSFAAGDCDGPVETEQPCLKPSSRGPLVRLP